MTDDELLSLAAKAAGLSNPSGDDDIWHDSAKGHDVQWTPLDDDGDSLRLAVTLRLHIEFHQGIKLRVSACYKIEKGTRCVYVECDGDDLRATRQAIVLAAAEIGKAMP